MRAAPAHPRVCGENGERLSDWLTKSGSSPRVRGKLDRVRRFKELFGLIPACAGKTPLHALMCTAPGAHPRVCGENFPHSQPSLFSAGSSPRMRGKLADQRSSDPDNRLIPAHAGKTFALSCSSTSKRAHPRACGENLQEACAPLTRSGSSPRMRGKLYYGGREDEHQRLIPAHAGKTVKKRATKVAVPAHPRACGENPSLEFLLGGGAGSSPRMRGKLRGRSLGPYRLGLIPAHAGKTIMSATA